MSRSQARRSNIFTRELLSWFTKTPVRPKTTSHVPQLTQVIPTDRLQLILRFEPAELRLYDCGAAKLFTRYPHLGSPKAFRSLSFGADAAHWRGGEVLGAQELYAASRPVSREELQTAQLELGTRNQAPNATDSQHDVFYVLLAPFSSLPFLLGESIRGGHAERGGANVFDLQQLLAWPRWREHFILSGCDWAVPLVEAGASQQATVDTLITERCRR